MTESETPTGDCSNKHHSLLIDRFEGPNENVTWFKALQEDYRNIQEDNANIITDQRIRGAESSRFI